MAPQPTSPSAANVPRKNDLVPQIYQLVGTNEAANVILIALTEDLFAYAGALLAICNVGSAIRAAPTNMQRR